MTITIKFILFQAIIIFPFLIGSLCKSRLRNPELLGKKLINFSLATLEPLIILWSIWGLAITKNLFFLPLAGLFIVITGFFIGKSLIPLLKLTGKTAKTYAISSSLANHGFTMGGFICYLLLGETGIGMASLFILCYMPWVFIVIFPYARGSNSSGISLIVFKKHVLNLQNMPLFALIVAVIIKAMGIKRPDIYFPVDFMMIITIVLYYFTLGINFNFIATFTVRKEQVSLAIEKFLLIPIITYIILQLIKPDPIIAKVILVQSCMPTAIYSVLTSILHDLDVELASGLFVLNTILFIVLVLPVILAINFA